ncbi:hypothetical protein MVES_002706 [Malassezia vespertilionis]|uniref:DH domain-containing protein n=2 Tax=Malassezia vespertilionis TaxID=2020962 RepID=A0A2N1JAK7_9BASI|nr:hypothetical protein MVES_002706 [Malassezia vespertilionis]
MNRDTSSPEIDTDISRASSTSTKESGANSLNAALDLKGSILRRESPTNASSFSSVSHESSSKSDTESFTSANAEIATETPSQHYEEKRDAKRFHSLVELAETEQNYAGDLDLLVNVFFAQLQHVPYFAESETRIKTVIRNSDQLLIMHKELSNSLSKVIQGVKGENYTDEGTLSSAAVDTAVVECAQIFVQFAPRFTIYNEFCAKHKEALGHIDAAEQHSSEWELFRMRSAQAAQQHLSSTALETGVPVTPRTLAQRRLLFRDFFIKPIQRVCLYPIILETLHKNSPLVGQKELQYTIEQMRNVTLAVDQASKIRESMLLTEMIASRLNFCTIFSPSLLASLGECKMAGSLDVLHHHRTLTPLSIPLPLKYYGCFLFADFVMMVKVRKSHTYEARFWFPLAEASLERTVAHDTCVPNSFRIRVRGHYFEMIASTQKECNLWIDAFQTALENKPSKTRRLHGADVPYPCNLQSEPGETLELEDPLHSILSNANETNAGRGRSATNVTGNEVLLRHKSPPRRAALDRGMLFTDACISARTSLDNDALRTQSSYVSGSLSSTMGAIVNLKRLSKNETLALRVPRSVVTTEHDEALRSRFSLDSTLVESPLGTSPSSPTLASGFSSPGGMENTSDLSGIRLRRIMKGSFSRKNSMQADPNDLAIALGSLTHRNSTTQRNAASVCTTPNIMAGPSQASQMSQQASAFARSRSSIGNPKSWFNGPTEEPAPQGSEHVLNRSSSFNWSALRARNWSTTSLKGLVGRRSSMDLDQELGTEPNTANPPFIDSRRSSISSNAGEGMGETNLEPARAASPRQRFAARFLQRHRMSSVSPNMDTK